MLAGRIGNTRAEEEHHTPILVLLQQMFGDIGNVIVADESHRPYLCGMADLWIYLSISAARLHARQRDTPVPVFHRYTGRPRTLLCKGAAK